MTDCRALPDSSLFERVPRALPHCRVGSAGLVTRELLRELAAHHVKYDMSSQKPHEHLPLHEWGNTTLHVSTSIPSRASRRFPPRWLLMLLRKLATVPYTYGLHIDLFDEPLTDAVLAAAMPGGGPAPRIAYIVGVNMEASCAVCYPWPLGPSGDVPAELLAGSPPHSPTAREALLLVPQMGLSERYNAATRRCRIGSMGEPPRHVLPNADARWTTWRFGAAAVARPQYLTQMRAAHFMLSPEGNGIDCFRHWDALAVGSVPVVEASPYIANLLRLFPALPLVVLRAEHNRTRDHCAVFAPPPPERSWRALQRCLWAERHATPPAAATGAAAPECPWGAAVWTALVRRLQRQYGLWLAARTTTSAPRLPSTRLQAERGRRLAAASSPAHALGHGTVAGRHSLGCEGCASVVDVRCRYHRQSMFFHRIADCVAPLWGRMVQQLQALLPAQRQGVSQRVCILGEAEVLGVYLEALGALRGALFVDSADPNALPARCLASSAATALRLYPAQYDTRGLCLERWCTRLPPRSERLLSALRADVSHALPLIRAHGDALVGSHGGAARRVVVLVTRCSVSITSKELNAVTGHNGTRRFASTALVALHASLSSLPRADLHEYRGTEDVRSTLRLFAHAHAVVGVHGAAHANVLFALRPCVVVEISTWLDHKGTQSHSQPRPWRSNGHLRHWSPLIDWVVYRVPLRDFVSEASELERARVMILTDRRRDLQLMVLSAVALSHRQAVEIGERVADSWAWDANWVAPLQKWNASAQASADRLTEPEQAQYSSGSRPHLSKLHALGQNRTAARHPHTPIPAQRRVAAGRAKESQQGRPRQPAEPLTPLQLLHCGDLLRTEPWKRARLVLLTHLTDMPSVWHLGRSAAALRVPLVVSGLGRAWGGWKDKLLGVRRAVQALDALRSVELVVFADGMDTMLLASPPLLHTAATHAASPSSLSWLLDAHHARVLVGSECSSFPNCLREQYARDAAHTRCRSASFMCFPNSGLYAGRPDALLRFVGALQNVSDPDDQAAVHQVYLQQRATGAPQAVGGPQRSPLSVSIDGSSELFLNMHVCKRTGNRATSCQYETGYDPLANVHVSGEGAVSYRSPRHTATVSPWIVHANGRDKKLRFATLLTRTGLAAMNESTLISPQQQVLLVDPAASDGCKMSSTMEGSASGF